MVGIGFLVRGKHYLKTFNRLDAFAVLASLSMSGIALLIHTGKGATFGTMMPLVVAIILLSKCFPGKMTKPDSLTISS